MLLKELLHLVEARDKELTYIDKKVKGAIERVTVALEGGKSSKFTKLSREFAEFKKAAEMLGEKQTALNAKIKDEALDLFDAEDEIYTRVVETVSMVITISKKTVSKTTKTDYEKVLEELVKLVPELTEQVKDLIEANTTTKEVEKSPGLRVDVNEGLTLKGIKAFARKALAKVKTWGKSYDRKLDNIKKLVDTL